VCRSDRHLHHGAHQTTVAQYNTANHKQKVISVTLQASCLAINHELAAAPAVGLEREISDETFIRANETPSKRTKPFWSDKE
jgi:hypothetical protein